MLFHSAALMLLDLASSFLFLCIVLVTHNVPMAIVTGMVFGVGQIGWEFARKRPIEVMQWMSLSLVLGSGVVSLITEDPRFVMLKPSLIYIVVGVVMLKPGWMTRYLPPIAQQIMPDVASVFGYVWAAMMFLTAALNLVAALHLDPAAWSEFMFVFAVASKIGLFGIQYSVMRLIGRRRFRLQHPVTTG
jgi:intracellular septation protein